MNTIHRRGNVWSKGSSRQPLWKDAVISMQKHLNYGSFLPLGRRHIEEQWTISSV